MTNDKPYKPPRWADRFLEWYCNPALVESIQGDVYELFYRTLKKGRTRAKLQFIWNVIRFFRWKNIRSTKSTYRTNSFIMLKSYLQIGFRNAMRNGATSFINIFGLAVGVAGLTTMFVFGDQFFHTDDFQRNKERLYAITAEVEQGNKVTTLSELPSALAPALLEESPAVESVNRIRIRDGALRYQDKVFGEQFYFTDKSFFALFNYPMLEGNTSALNSPANIIFTRHMAEKYFGDQPALGQTISIKFSNEHRAEFTVAAVVDQPANNTMFFDFLLPMEAFETIYQTTQNWKDPVHASFLLLKPDHRIEEVTPLMGKYLTLQNESSPEWKVVNHKFYHFPDLSTRSYEIEDAVIGSGQPQGVLALGFIAFMLLLLACFNYMNIAIATVATRLKEIGIRKVIGGQRKEILQQFITENFLLCALAMSIGALISYFFFMPWLTDLVGYKIPFAFSSSFMMITFFAGLLIFVVLLSGLYPALYISRFQPVIILKGKEKFGQRSRLSRVLLTLQFVLAFTTIVGCFVFIDNSFYLKNKDWGYQHDQNLVVPVNSTDQYIALRNKVADQENIARYAGARNHIGMYRSTSSIEHTGMKFESVVYPVGFNYLETMNLRLSSGRFFEESIQSDQIESVVVNENFVRAMGWDHPINQTFEYDSIKRNVIGVVSNFHYTDFYRDILPVMFVITPENQMRQLALQVNGGSIKETEAWVREVWKEIAPDDPYEGMLQNDVFYNWEKNNKTEIKLMSFIAVITVLLACLGLFGLVSYNITRRLKEFSVRKVFGANAIQIFKLMNKDYVWILLIAFLIGAPAGLFLMDTLLHIVYIEPQSAKPTPFLMAVGLMVLTVAVTIGSQMTRVTTENPAKTLRSE